MPRHLLSKALAVSAGMMLVNLVLAGLVGSASAVVQEPRIVQGKPTTTAEHPWQAELLINNAYLCGGVLISPTVVLTAAHCLVDATSPAGVLVTLGRDTTFAGGTTQVAAAVFVNPGFQKKGLVKDWAFAVLPAPAAPQFTPLKIAGPDETALWRPGAKATVTGYGTKSENGPLSVTLREVSIPILDDRVCGSGSSYGSHFHAEAMLCAGDTAAGKDSCQGDSGGPLTVLADDGTPRLAGIVSFGYGCAEKHFPGVYTRIADPTLSSRLVQQLAAATGTSDYPYLGSGGACTSATNAAHAAARRLRRATHQANAADRRERSAETALQKARDRYRAKPGAPTKRALVASLARERRAATLLHADLRLARHARKDVARATAGVSLACG